MDLSARLGKTLYALAFVVALPIVLVAWARGLAPDVALRPLLSPLAGGALLAAGVAVILASMRALWTHGGGLPMNAYPPPRLVTRGPYAVASHPIYVGFVLACAGASIAFGSASGLWIVTPLSALGCAALVCGYEARDLEARFGARPLPWLAVPRDEPRAPTRGERAAAYALVLAPWALLYEAAVFLGPPSDAIDGTTALDRVIPVVEHAEPIYATAYVAALAAPLAARTAGELRTFVIRGLLAMALVYPLFFVVPLVSPPRPFVPVGAWGRILLLERALDTPAAAFPSFHVVWAILAAATFAARGGFARLVAWSWAGVVTASCVLTGMHTLVDVAGGLAAGYLVVRAGRVWNALRGAAERIANSWSEVRVGPVRIINHALWAGLAVTAGVLLVGAMTGPAYTAPMSIAAACGLVAAGLWAQVIEGSPVLLRPYGFYGGLLGIVLGSLAAPVFGASTWTLLGAFAVAAPVIQSLGRLRCLVQGCCHGAPAPERVGIRYLRARSRVCAIAHLRGAPLHPTPLYSIAWNVLLFAVLARAWSLHTRAHAVAGAYLVMGGLGRFVEEAYRGEPQTKVVARLRLYQWIAAAQVAAGMLASGLGRSTPAPPVRWGDAPLGLALAAGLVSACALGVDFPDSNRRFSRLA